jgi:HAD superfamily hydrolase (TIGR01509 family)
LTHPDRLTMPKPTALSKTRPAALLDVDGTLVDSNDAHTRAWLDVLKEVGHEVPYERVRRLIGKGGDKLVPEITGRDDEKWVKELGEKKNEAFFDRYFDSIRGFPHARELLERMRAAGLALVVATSAKEEEMKKLLGIVGVADLLHDEATKDDAKRSKPDPDIVGAALERAGVGPEWAIMLGDTPWDIEAARKAGVGTVALECGGWREPDLTGAIAVYRDPSDLLRAFDESPFARLAAKRQAA